MTADGLAQLYASRAATIRAAIQLAPEKVRFVGVTNVQLCGAAPFYMPPEIGTQLKAELDAAEKQRVSKIVDLWLREHWK